MQQYAFINNNAIVLVSTLDDYTKTLPYEKIEIEKIDFEKYNQGLDIKLENGKVSFYSGERKKQFDEDAQKMQEEQEKFERAEKFARIYQKLVELPELNATTDTAILEGLKFSSKEIYELIADRVYSGNPYEPIVIVGNMVFNKNDQEFLEDTQKKLMLSNQILAFFGMDKLWPLEREEAKKKAREEIEMMKLTPAQKSKT